MNIALYICAGILAILIFGVIIPRLMSGLPKMSKKNGRFMKSNYTEFGHTEDNFPWRSYDEFDGK